MQSISQNKKCYFCYKEGHKYVNCPSKYQIDQDFKDTLSLKMFELFKVKIFSSFKEFSY